MKFTPSSGGERVKLPGLALFALAVLGLASALPILAQQESESSRTEIFRVSRVGMGGAAETRERLLGLYEVVANDYNEQVRQEQQSNPQLYKGDRVRVLRDLGSGSGGSLFLVAYNGGPVVFEVTGDTSAIDPGDLSPALLIGGENGQHSVEITRTITVKDPKQPEPQLETVEDTGGAVTFFGIAIPGTGGGSSSSSSGGSKGSGGGTRSKEVTETKMMPKYTATISTERLDGGPQEMSTQLFVSQLKNGEVFTVSRPEQRRCQECRGFGRVTTDKPPGFRDPDGKMECPECKAKGKIDWDITYKIAW